MEVGKVRNVGTITAGLVGKMAMEWNDDAGMLMITINDQ